MKSEKQITEYIKTLFEFHSLNYNEYFSDVEDDLSITEIPFFENGEINMEMLALASQALGISEEDILNTNKQAYTKWTKKYPFFDLLQALDYEYKQTYYARGIEEVRLFEAIFDWDLTEHKPLRYDYDDVKIRLLKKIKELDKSFPGTYHPKAKITNLEIETETFCHFFTAFDKSDNINVMLESLFEMVEKVKELFFKAWDKDLCEDEIQEYNIIVSALGMCDKYCTSRYLYYNSLKKCVELYKKEGYKDFYDYIYFKKEKTIAPWRCAEFSADKELVQKYANIFSNTKQLMRDFALKVSQFVCDFIWSDAKPIEWDLGEEALTLFGTDIYEEETVNNALEITTIYIPKTENEMNEDSKFVQMILKLCSPEKLGGIHQRKCCVQHRDYYEKLYLRIELIKDHRYNLWMIDDSEEDLFSEIKADDNTDAMGGGGNYE